MAQPAPERLRPAARLRPGASPHRAAPGCPAPARSFTAPHRARVSCAGPELHRPAPRPSVLRRPGTSPPRHHSAGGRDIFPDRCNRFSALPPGRLSPQRSMPPRHRPASGCNIFPDRCNRFSCPAAAWRTGAATLPAAPPPLTGQRAYRRRQRPWRGGAPGRPRRQRCGIRRWDGGPGRPADRTGRAAGPCAAPRPARGR